MDSFKLKIIACLAMLIDHIGAVFFPEYRILRVIGRLAFPIFAYLITAGYKNTKNVNVYMKRLFLFFFISQIPFMLAFDIKGLDYLNIFSTLFLGLLAIYSYDKIEDRQLRVIIVILIAIFAKLLGTDYGWYGVMIIFSFKFFEDNFPKLLISMILLNILYQMPIVVYCIRNGKVFLRFPLFMQSFSLISLILIKYYNGERGRNLKYVFYAFYPIHLFIIFIIKFFM
jgi:hypothetical protein